MLVKTRLETIKNGKIENTAFTSEIDKIYEITIVQ